RGDRRSQQRLAARPAAALDEALAVRVVVVGQLLAFTNRSCRAYPDDAVLDVDITVRPARMIDIARVVPAYSPIAGGAVREFEAPDVTAPNVAALAFETLLVRDLLARVVDDACVLGNGRRRVDAPALDLRFPPFDHRSKGNPVLLL